MKPDAVRRVAFVNFGGIGDEVLFSPVIEEVKRHLPQVHITLFLEDRSRAVKDLLPHVDSVIELNLQGQPRYQTFFQLWRLLRSKYFDAVISSGSNPLIPVLLFLSGIPLRVGFQTGPTSRLFLTAQAPLAPKHNRKGYAAQMYFALAQSFLHGLLGNAYQPNPNILPHLKAPTLDDLHWAKRIIPPDDPTRKILVHPGVSLVSVQKNILKSWPAASWAELIQKLCQEGHQVYLVGGPDDRQAVEAIRRQLPIHLPNFTDLYGQTKNLRQLAALIQASDLLLCVDSSPMHLAVGYGKPLIAMFGPTDEKKLLPPNDPRFKAVTMPDLPCRPCLWDVRNESCAQPVCLDVPLAAMLAAVNTLLSPTDTPSH